MDSSCKTSGIAKGLHGSGKSFAGLPGQALITRGVPGPALVRIADRDTDVLVIGAGRRGRLRRALGPSVSRHCLAHATCPVLAVPPSPLQATLDTAHRRNLLHLRLDVRHVEGQSRTP
ncbi:universal stress protein [Streptomyces sp. NPDC003832]